MQERAFADIALPHGNRRSGAAIGRLLQVLVARECKAMGEQTVEIAKDGTPDAARAYHCNRKRERRERRLQCRARDDPCSRTDERNARGSCEYAGKECGQCLARCRNGEQTKECPSHISQPPNVIT